MYNVSSQKNDLIKRLCNHKVIYRLSSISEEYKRFSLTICRTVTGKESNITVTYGTITFLNSDFNSDNFEVISEAKMKSNSQKNYESFINEFISEDEKKYNEYFKSLKPEVNSKKDLSNLNSKGWATFTRSLNIVEFHNKVGGSTIQFGGECCAFTKQALCDFTVYIPTLWAKIMGYSATQIERYVKLLNDCDINFGGEFLGEKRLPEVYHFSKNVNEYSKSWDYENKRPSALSPINCDYYCIKIKNSGDRYNNYMKFIMIRWLYNCQYWNLPGVAMQIKYALKDKVTSLQALLMAASCFNYYEFYHLVHDGRIINPFKDPSEFINYKDQNTNSYFSKGSVENRVTRREIFQFLKNKDFQGMLDYFNKKLNRK